VLVTGGSGKLGRACVRDLLDHGHQVTNADLVGAGEEPVATVRVDLADAGQVFELLDGIDFVDRPDAVVHLAAIPGPGKASNAETFRNNIVSTYNVFEAARRTGLKNVVYASTEIIFGLPFAAPPAYLPLDEEAPRRPESAYGLSKLLAEEMAEQFCRWDPELKMIGLRFSNVQEPSDYRRFPAFADAPYDRRWNLWAYIDARDGAQAIRKALESDLRGAEVFTIANAESVLRHPNANLIEECFPGVTVRDLLGENESLLSINKARRLLGYEPEHHWWSEPVA